jgi:hypothetical protein
MPSGKGGTSSPLLLSPLPHTQTSNLVAGLCSVLSSAAGGPVPPGAVSTTPLSLLISCSTYLRSLYSRALLMPTAPASRICLLTPTRPGLFTIAATSLIAVPSALHAVAPRRVACEFPGGIVLRSLYPKKKKKNSARAADRFVFKQFEGSEMLVASEPAECPPDWRLCATAAAS